MEKPFPAYGGDGAYVFVCYSHDDKAAVYPELVCLRDSGFNVWYDEGIAPGSEWSDALADHIERCAVFLYFVSPRSVRSEHCRREVAFALEQNCALLAAHLQPTQMPGGLKLTLSNRQAILAYELPRPAFQSKLELAIRSLIRGASEPSELQPAPAPGRSDHLGPWKRTIAVLPFSNLSRDPDQDYFSEGISEDILDALASNPSLTVRARQSSFLFKGHAPDLAAVAEQLDVAYLVTGSVRTQGQRVRVSARLTDVAAKAEVWSTRLDRELHDVFAVQDEITEAVVTSLGIHFSSQERPAVRFDAYDAYLAGRHHQYRWEFDLAMKHLERAIELDPTYAAAHAALAQACATLEWASPPEREQLVAIELEHVEAALRHDPGQPLALGLQALRLPPQAAIDVLDALMQRFPNDVDILYFYSAVFQRLGLFDQQMVLLERMVTLDPLSARTLTLRAEGHLVAGRTGPALEDIRRVEQLGVPLPWMLVQVGVLEDDPALVLEQFERPEEDWGYAPIWRILMCAYLPRLQGDAGAVAAAVKPIHEWGGHLPSFIHCMVSLLEGRDRAALEHWETSLERHESLPLAYVQGQALMLKLFPEFFASDGYHRMLERFGLDRRSVAALRIPPLTDARGQPTRPARAPVASEPS